MKFAPDYTRVIDSERKSSITEYLKLNKDFAELRQAGICSYIIINYLQEEIDLDKLDE
jgi:hypothetical protein